jgi:hypothetical protein
MTNVVFDATLLSSLMSCARLTNMRHNLNFVQKDGKSNSLECGSLVHVILEFYNKALMLGKSRKDAIDDGFAAGIEYRNGYKLTNKFITDEAEGGMKNTPDENEKKPERTGYNFVIKTMQEYFDFYRNDSHTCIAAEEVRSKLIYEDDEMRILWKAKFDLIMDTANGILSKDYKTMKQRRDTLSMSNQFMGHCVLLGSRNVMVDKIGFQTSLKPEEKFTRAIISYSTDRLAEWVNDIVPFYARMYIAYTESGNWPANFTHCENKYGTCPMLRVCESDRSLRDDELKMNFMIGPKWEI